MGSYYPVLWVLILQIVKLKILLNRLTTAVKFLMFKVVNQNDVNDNNYSFDVFGTYTKGENHNFVGTIGNTIYKEWGSSLNATCQQFMGLCRYSLTTGFVEAKQMTLMYMTKEDFLIW
jgi:hypothetical protein